MPDESASDFGPRQGLDCSGIQLGDGRLTSVAHAASASSSASLSRLSSSDPARAARASIGSASASFRISAASRFMVRFYLPERFGRAASRLDRDRSIGASQGT